jgi:hypothetical protein
MDVAAEAPESLLEVGAPPKAKAPDAAGALAVLLLLMLVSTPLKETCFPLEPELFPVQHMRR